MKNNRTPGNSNDFAPDNRNRSEMVSWEAICRDYVQPQARPALLAEIRLQRQQRQDTRNRNRVWRIAAAFALLFPILAALSLLPHGENELTAMQRFNSINQPQQLKFVVNAQQSHDQVTFSLRAPSQWAFYGYRGSQYLSWSGKLKAGPNLLSIPLVAHQAVDGTLVVTISHKDAVKEYRIPLQVGRQPA